MEVTPEHYPRPEMYQFKFLYGINFALNKVKSNQLLENNVQKSF